MIVLDTDVLSAILRRENEKRVVAWLDSQVESDLHITTITLFEILAGIEKLPAGRRRKALEVALDSAVNRVLDGRVIPFDAAAAHVAASLFGSRRRKGVTVGAADTQIAGIVISRGATLATRNARHFADLSVPVVDPWQMA